MKYIGRIKLILVISIPAILFLSFCSRRPFAHIKVRGQIIDAQTNRPPVQADLSLWAGCDPSEACSEGNNFGKARTNEDGTFEIKSKAQWKGTEYYLVLTYKDSTNNNHGQVMRVRVSNNKNLDLGIIKF